MTIDVTTVARAVGYLGCWWQPEASQSTFVVVALVMLCGSYCDGFGS